MGINGVQEEEEQQDGVSTHSPCQAPPSSVSSLPKELPQVELEVRVLEALEFYPPVKLQGIHRHFVIYGLMEYLRRSLDRHFSPDEVLQLLDRFYNLEMLKPDEEDVELLSQEEEFSLPQFFWWPRMTLFNILHIVTYVAQGCLLLCISLQVVRPFIIYLSKRGMVFGFMSHFSLFKAVDLSNVERVCGV